MEIHFLKYRIFLVNIKISKLPWNQNLDFRKVRFQSTSWPLLLDLLLRLTFIFLWAIVTRQKSKFVGQMFYWKIFAYEQGRLEPISGSKFIFFTSPLIIRSWLYFNRIIAYLIYYMGHIKYCTKTDMPHTKCSISNTAYGMMKHKQISMCNILSGLKHFLCLQYCFQTLSALN